MQTSNVSHTGNIELKREMLGYISHYAVQLYVVT
jgi:hypothetical protein